MSRAAVGVHVVAALLALLAAMGGGEDTFALASTAGDGHTGVVGTILAAAAAVFALAAAGTAAVIGSGLRRRGQATAALSAFLLALADVVVAGSLVAAVVVFETNKNGGGTGEDDVALFLGLVAAFASLVAAACAGVAGGAMKKTSTGNAIGPEAAKAVPVPRMRPALHFAAAGCYALAAVVAMATAGLARTSSAARGLAIAALVLILLGAVCGMVGSRQALAALDDAEREAKRLRAKAQRAEAEAEAAGSGDGGETTTAAAEEAGEAADGGGKKEPAEQDGSLTAVGVGEPAATSAAPPLALTGPTAFELGRGMFGAGAAAVFIGLAGVVAATGAVRATDSGASLGATSLLVHASLASAAYLFGASVALAGLLASTVSLGGDEADAEALARARRAVAAREARIAELEAEAAAAEAAAAEERARLEAELEAARADLESAQADAQGGPTESDVAELQSAIEARDAEIDSLRRSLQASGSDEELIARAELAEAEKRKLRERVDALQNQSSARTNQHMDKLSAMQVTVDEVEAKLHITEDDRDRIGDELSQAQEEIRTLQLELSESRDAAGNATQMADEIRELKEQKRTLQQTMADELRDYDMLRAELKEKNARMEEYEERLARKKAKIARLRADYEALKGRIPPREAKRQCKYCARLFLEVDLNMHEHDCHDDALVKQGRSLFAALKTMAGVSVKDGPARGCLVTKVIDDGPAYAAGIRANDVILAVNNMPTDTNGDFRALLQRLRPGDIANFHVQQPGGRVLLDVELGASGTSRDRMLYLRRLNDGIVYPGDVLEEK